MQEIIERIIADSKHLREILKTRRAGLSAELSDCDKALSDLYHEAENTRFNVVQGYKHLVRIQNTLKKRRLLKDEIAELESTIAHLYNLRKKLNHFSENCGSIELEDLENEPGNNFIALVK